jgi:hypothetical protein
MSAISHKVNTHKDLVNDYLRGSSSPVPAQVHPESVTGEDLNSYFNPKALWNRAQH